MEKITTSNLPDELQQILKMHLSDQILESLNEILTAEERSDEDIKNAISISYHILRDYNNMNSAYVENALYNFAKFYISKQRGDSESFSKLLSNMLAEIVKQDENLSNSNEDEEKRKFLIQKINTASLLGNNGEGLSYKEIYSYMLKIIRMTPKISDSYGDISWNNLTLLNSIIESQIVNWNLYNKQYFIDVVLTEEASCYTAGNGCDFEEEVYSSLTNQLLLSEISESYFKKAVKIIIKNFQGCIFSNAINRKSVTKAKLEAIIDYYTTIFERYGDEGSIILKENAEDISAIPIYSVVYSKRLLEMSDSEYKSELERILNCSKPHSYAMVVAVSELEDSKRKLALATIKTGDSYPVIPEKVNDEYKDYKHYVAEAAIAPILRNINTDDYLDILVTINFLCGKANNNEKESHLIKRKLDNILFLLQHYNFKVGKSNVVRLKKAVNEIKNSNDTKEISEFVTAFCINQYSMYYTDDEYNKILRLIRESGSYERSRVLVNIFLCSNVPYMEDRSELFEAVSSPTCSVSTLQEYLKSLNQRGNDNKNKHKIFDGVSDSVIYTLTGDNTGIGEAPSGKSAK